MPFSTKETLVRWPIPGLGQGRYKVSQTHESAPGGGEPQKDTDLSLKELLLARFGTIGLSEIRYYSRWDYSGGYWQKVHLHAHSWGLSHGCLTAGQLASPGQDATERERELPKENRSLSSTVSELTCSSLCSSSSLSCSSLLK